jgi:hypothetical protein
MVIEDIADSCRYGAQVAADLIWNHLTSSPCVDGPQI